MKTGILAFISIVAAGSIIWYFAILNPPRAMESDDLETVMSDPSTSEAQKTDTDTTQEKTAFQSDSGTYLGYIKKLYSGESNSWYLDIDYVAWFSEHENTCKNSEEDNRPIPLCNPGGFLIQNNDPHTRSVRIDPKVSVSVYKQGDSSVTLETFDFNDWVQCINKPEANPTLYNFGNCTVAPYDITLKNGMTTRIRERYVP